jgi:NTE family protein
MPIDEGSAPVERIPGDPVVFAPSPGIALCLSGGGYRAMLFHVGTLWRLNTAGYLPRIDRVSSVSGGSITAGMLGLAWNSLAFNDKGVGQRFDDEIVAPIRRLAGTTIDVPSVLRGLFGSGGASDKVADAYRKHLFGGRTLRDLPDERHAPRFVINATNLQSGVLWRFSRDYARDYRVGEIRNPTIDLALAVAASSAFPPFISPTVLKPKESDYTPNSGLDLQRPPYTTEVILTDGGVYDNLGLETAWKRYTTVLVSDGGGKLGAEESIGRDYARQTLRVLNVIDNQVRSLRKRQLIASYEADAGDPDHRRGAYWGIRTDIAGYRLPDALPCPVGQTTKLANISTRLAKLGNTEQERLINWGFAVCDAALRTYVDTSLPRPDDFPYPGAKVG